MLLGQGSAGMSAVRTRGGEDAVGGPGMESVADAAVVLRRASLLTRRGAADAAAASEDRGIGSMGRVHRCGFRGKTELYFVGGGC